MTEVAVDLGKELETLASAMLKDACRENTPLSQKMQVFRDISTHYVNMEKVRGKNAPAGGSYGAGTTMGALRQQVADAGSAPIEQAGNADEPSDGD